VSKEDIAMRHVL